MAEALPEDRRGAADRFARAIAHALSPSGVAVLVCLAWMPGSSPDVASTGGSGPLAAALVGVLSLGVVPAAVVLRMARRADLVDVYDPPQALRQRIILAGTSCYSAGYLLVAGLGLGPAWRWAAACFVLGSACVWLIDRHWKISIHNTGAGGGAVLLAHALGAMWPLGAVLPMLAGWARYRLRAHTPAQLIAGALLGAGVALALRTVFL